MTEIRRVEKAIQALEVPTHIAKDCLSNRQRRIDTDLVQDNAENQLLRVSAHTAQAIHKLCNAKRGGTEFRFKFKMFFFKVIFLQ